jgi:hypothetical protein
MADDNNNTSTNTANADFYSGEDNDGGDIEQGRIIISGNSGSRSSSSSWIATAITGGTSTPTTSTTTITTTRTLGGLENVDVEDAAPVPLIQQIADMEELEKKDNVAPIEDASTTPQPPQQEAMLEQIEDDAAPRPFTDFERESRLKIELEEISTNEDDGPPLPLS